MFGTRGNVYSPLLPTKLATLSRHLPKVARGTGAILLTLYSSQRAEGWKGCAELACICYASRTNRQEASVPPAPPLIRKAQRDSSGCKSDVGIAIQQRIQRMSTSVRRARLNPRTLMRGMEPVYVRRYRISAALCGSGRRKTGDRLMEWPNPVKLVAVEHASDRLDSFMYPYSGKV